MTITFLNQNHAAPRPMYRFIYIDILSEK